MDGADADKSLEELIREERRRGAAPKKIAKPPHPPRAEVRNPPRRGDAKPSRKTQEGEKRVNLPSVQVSNLPAGITCADVRTLFATCGPLERINTYWTPELADRFNARVFYRDADTARKAVEVYNQAKLDGQTLAVKFNEA